MPASSSSSTSSASARPQDRAPQRSYADAVAGANAAACPLAPFRGPPAATNQEDLCTPAAAQLGETREKLLCPQDTQCLYLSDPVHHTTHRHSCPRRRCPLRGLGKHSEFFLHPEDDGMARSRRRERERCGRAEHGQPTRGRLVAYDLLDCTCCVFSANTARLSVGRTKRILAEAFGLGMEGDVSSVELFDSYGRHLVERGRMLEQCGVLPGSVLYVDDAARCGILLARRRRAAARLLIMTNNRHHRALSPAARQPHHQPQQRSPQFVVARASDPSPVIPRCAGGPNPQQRANGPRVRAAVSPRHATTPAAGSECRTWSKLGVLVPVIVSWITDAPPGFFDVSTRDPCPDCCSDS